MHDLLYPAVTTYFIAWDDGEPSYGSTSPIQQTTSGRVNFETFIDENLYLTRLTELGVISE